MGMLVFDNEMYNFLNFTSSDSIISAILLQGESSHLRDDCNYIAHEEGEIDVISFLPKSKYEKVEDKFSEGRIKIKIGRFVNKILTEFSFSNFKIDNQVIEKFVNSYKYYFSSDESKLKIVEGKDILKYYREDAYDSTNGTVGTLWNSCMRQKERNKFMTLYSKNPDSVKMLIYLTEEGKIRARALLWDKVKEHDTGKEYKVMDRIYYLYEHDVKFFKNWAKNNGYISKLEQNARTEMLFDVNGKESILKLYVILNNCSVSYYPYLDTFKFYSYDRNRFSNSPEFHYNYVLVQCNGYPERDCDHDEGGVPEDEDQGPGSFADDIIELASPAPMEVRTVRILPYEDFYEYRLDRRNPHTRLVDYLDPLELNLVEEAAPPPGPPIDGA